MTHTGVTDLPSELKSCKGRISWLSVMVIIGQLFGINSYPLSYRFNLWSKITVLPRMAGRIQPDPDLAA